MPSPTVEVHLTAADLARQLREDVREGLSATPKRLPAKWHYDRRGSELFDRITALDEYYPTRRERQILEARSGEIATASGADTLIEIGAGFAEKSRILLRGLAAAGTLRRFVPFDVSEPTLREAAERVLQEYPGIEVHAIVGDFERQLDLLPEGGRRLIAFLGSTVGNLDQRRRAALLSTVAAGMGSGDRFLLGADLVKDPERLRLAYDDPAGLSAAFNLNVLARLNDELGADFDVGSFRHDAQWVPEREWMQMSLRSLKAQVVQIRSLEMTVSFERDEVLLSEVSAKFQRPRLESELGRAGLRLHRWWTDLRGDFSVSLWRREATSSSSG
jgi:L-histidine N-alpha-methyltransferase